VITGEVFNRLAWHLAQILAMPRLMIHPDDQRAILGAVASLRPVITATHESASPEADWQEPSG
jgi:hypothetical protein